MWLNRLLLAVLLILTGGVSALQAKEVLFKNGYAEIISDPEDIDQIRMAVGFKTLLLFPSDEKIVRVEVGIRGNVLEVRYGVNWVTIRPGEEKLATNLHVATDRGRVYSFDLVDSDKKNAHRKVIVLRPDMDLDPDGGPTLPTNVVPSSGPKPMAPMNPGASGPKVTPGKVESVPTASGRTVTVDDLDVPLQIKQGHSVPGLDMMRRLDHEYDIKNGNPKIFAVDTVYNDGERTFVRFKSRLNESPLFYRIGEKNKREILTYRLETASDPRDADLFVIPRLFDKATVKVGDVETHIEWRAAKINLK